jgi:E3 ubiquitin-protein ligase SHPRH
MAQLTNDVAKKQLTREAMLIDSPFLDESGIESLIRKLKPTRAEPAVGSYNRAVESHARVCTSSPSVIILCLFAYSQIAEVNKIIADVLDGQGVLLWEWRASIISLLTQKLSPGEEQADGEEYQRTLDSQGEAETYLQAYTALLADRRQALINERTLLAAHDQREKKLRHTKAAIKAAANDDRLEVPEGIELQPEHEVLHLRLSAQRKGLLQRLKGRAIKSVSESLDCRRF